ncbi:MAG: hypothetical protein D6704_07530 [Nitrospirae bacterium]|nr:MAG: hypothetical protein D6704_07530 [Nitrospirota bacterium]
MKNVQIVFTIQVPDHVSEQEVSAKLNEVLGSLMAQEFGLDDNANEFSTSSPSEHGKHIGHA